jgi:hypothetical protein
MLIRRDGRLSERLEREHRRRLELKKGGLTEIVKPKLFSGAAKTYLDE